MSKVCFVDVESTSLDDQRGEVWEIGLIEPGGGEWLWQLAPTRMHAADPNSLRISRFYERFDTGAEKHGALIVRAPGVKGQPVCVTPAEVAAALARILDGAHVCGAVPDFDYRFLRAFLREHGQVWTAHYHLIDVEALAVGWLHGKAAQLVKSDPGPDWRTMAAEVVGLPWRSTDLYRSVGVDPNEFEAHTALGDARLVRAVYKTITEGV